ncbi:MAG: DnaJ domain-containing protein [Campylobacterota bacterium]|nr:DnaJ domain-containing protein [Campylobacterota bacterium]
MIKKIIGIFIAVVFLLIKKIFVRENRVPHKIMDSLANKLHSMFIFTSLPMLYLLWFDIYINSYSLNSFIYLTLFLQFVMIIRYFNPEMIKEKKLQSNIIKKISKVFLIIFILNWIFFSFLFALSFFIISIVNYGFYVFIINQINKQKEQEEFKKQFGEGNYSKQDIVKKHILNLFDADLDINNLTKSDVKKQYRTMAKKYHPDVYKGDEKDKFASINLSYQFLLDLVK